MFIVLLIYSIQGYADTWTFICPEPQNITVQGSEWEAKMIVFLNDKPYPFPVTYVNNNPSEQPVSFSHVDLFPYQDPSSEINCYYNVASGNTGYVSTRPYGLPNNCHFSSGGDAYCYSTIQDCKVICD